MTIYSVPQQKGGATKTTTAGHLARWLSLRQRSVAIIDCDVQQSSFNWLSTLDIGGFEADVSVMSTTDEILEGVPEVASRVDDVVIDCPAGLSELTRAILLRTDVALVPCQPTMFDLSAVGDAVRLIAQAQSVRRGEPKAALFLARAKKRTKLKGEAVAALGKFGLPVLKSVVHDRQCIADVFGQSTTVFDMAGEAAAASAREFHLLFKEAINL